MLPLISISQLDKKKYVDYAYSLIDSAFGRRSDPFPSVPPIKGYDRIFITLMHNHSVKGCQSGKADPSDPHRTELDLSDAVGRCLQDERFGKSLSKDELDDVEIVFNILHNKKRVKGKLEDLVDEIELGVHAIELVNGTKRAFFKESVPITKNYGLKKTLDRLCKKAGLDVACINNSDTEIYKYETFTFKGNRKGRIVDLYRYNILVDPKDITINLIHDRISLAKSWFLNNIDERTGRMQYMYLPSSDEYSTDNNHIRQIATVWSIAQLKGFLNDSSLETLINDSLDYYLNHILDMGDFCFVRVDDPVNIANSAFLILALLHTPDYPDNERWMERLAKGILSLQLSDGSYKTMFWLSRFRKTTSSLRRLKNKLIKLKKGGFRKIAFYIRHPKRAVRKAWGEPDRSIDFYPGEAMLALMSLYQRARTKSYLESVEKAFPYYRDYWRKNRNTAFIPWHTQTLLLLYEETENHEISEFVFEMNDWLIDNYQIRESQFQDKIGGFGEAYPGSSTSSYLEGLNDALGLARMIGDTDHLAKYEEAIRLGTRCMLLMQYTMNNAFYVKNQSRAVGGFRQSIVNNSQRIDHTQHALNALMKTYKNGIFKS